MQKVSIGRWIPNFDEKLLSHCHDKNKIWIHRGTRWATRWQPSQFRQPGRFPLNRTQVDISGQLTTRTPNLPMVQLQPGTVANTIKQPKCILQYYLLWMWSHGGTWQWSWLREPTDYDNSPASGWSIVNTANSGHSLQHMTNWPSSHMLWKFSGHSGTGLCGCQNGIGLLCIMVSLCIMTYLIIWVALFKL